MGDIRELLLIGWHGLWPDKRRRLLLSAIAHWDSLFRDEQMWPVVRAQAVREALIASSYGWTLDRDEAERRSLGAVTHLAQQLTTSGTYHIYRGSLNMAGNSLRSIVRAALREMSDLGWISQEERSAASENFAEAIKLAG